MTPHVSCGETQTPPHGIRPQLLLPGTPYLCPHWPLFLFLPQDLCPCSRSGWRALPPDLSMAGLASPLEPRPLKEALPAPGPAATA